MMSENNPEDIQVGDVLYFSGRDRLVLPQEITVKKVGRKFFYFDLIGSGEQKASLEPIDQRETSARFKVEFGFGSSSVLWRSKEAHDHASELGQAWHRLESKFRGYRIKGNPSLSPERIDAIRVELFPE